MQLVFQHPEKAVNTRWHMESTLKEGWEPDKDLLKALGIEKSGVSAGPMNCLAENCSACVARALSPATQFLIADEMTTMLDAITQAQIWQVILDTACRRNMGVLIVSHEAKLLERLCSRIIKLNPCPEARGRSCATSTLLK